MELLVVISIIGILAAIILASISVSTSQSSPAHLTAPSLALCADLAFSTEENFITRGPVPPDGNPLISDGDLLGPDGAICARNADLVEPYDVKADLGLDAVDILNVESAIVAFSTELDSPNVGQFSAGDLLITNVTIIPNQVLTYAYDDGGIGYDLGLDAVQFVGALENIDKFLGNVPGPVIDDWIRDPSLLSTLLTEYSIDIWFSTEGSWKAGDPSGFVDGDLLSARDGKIVAANSDLFPASVPAGIPLRGVDFGLDAAANARSLELPQLKFSTEIPYTSQITSTLEIASTSMGSFSAGDALRYGNGIEAMNWELVKPFEPKAEDLGLDGLFIGPPPPPECRSRITHIGGVAVGDIDPARGLIQPGVVGGINSPVAFAGETTIGGTLCPDIDDYRVVYRKLDTSDTWQPIPVLTAKNWLVKTDSFFPPGPDCLGNMTWFSTSDGWFNAPSYRHLTEPVLGGCNPNLALTVWDSSAAYSSPDDLYELMLETRIVSASSFSAAHAVQLDHTDPIVELEKLPGFCGCDAGVSMPYMVRARILDNHFYRYGIQFTGDSYATYVYPPVTYFDDPADNVTATGTIAWGAYQDLHDISVFDLSPNPVECGYTVWITVFDRTLESDFIFPSNFANRCAGCRSKSDLWTFNFIP